MAAPAFFSPKVSTEEEMNQPKSSAMSYNLSPNTNPKTTENDSCPGNPTLIPVLGIYYTNLLLRRAETGFLKVTSNVLTPVEVPKKANGNHLKKKIHGSCGCSSV
jgi:hypothetical protein